MHKSSSITFFFKYIFPFLMMGATYFNIYVFWNSDNPENVDLAKGMIFIAAWITFFLVQMLRNLKNTEATEEGILVKSFHKKQLIPYSTVRWITRFHLSNPFGVTLKYYDTKEGTEKTLSYLPQQQSQKGLKDDVMMAYIKEKAAAHNPDFSSYEQPSPGKNLLLITLLGLPFMLLFLYFSGFLQGF